MSTVLFTGSRTIGPALSPSVPIVCPSVDVANSANLRWPARLCAPIVRETFWPWASAPGPPDGPLGTGKTSILSLPMLLTNRGSMYGPVRYIPPMPLSNVSCARGVSMLTASGLTTLRAQNMSLSQLTACTALGSLTTGRQVPVPAPVRKSPPLSHRYVEKYQDMYPRFVVPGMTSPYVSALPSPSGSRPVNAVAMFARSVQLLGSGRCSLARQSARTKIANVCAEKGTA